MARVLVVLFVTAWFVTPWLLACSSQTVSNTATPTLEPTPTPVPAASLIPTLETPAVGMTVTEYANAWCRSEDTNQIEEMTNGEATQRIESILEEASEIVPPNEIRAYHDAQLNTLTAIKSSLSLESPDEPYNPFSLFAVGLAIAPMLEQARSELSSEAYSILSDAGCIEEEVEEATLTPEPTPHAPGLSVNNPVPAGGTLEGSDGTQIIVLNVVRDAWPLIKAENENSFWTPKEPMEGYRYIMISLQVAYVSGSDSISVSSSRFSLTDDNRVLLTQSENSCGGYSNTVPEELSGEMFVGGKIAGNVCFEIGNEVSDLILIYEPYGSFGSERRFLRLE